MRGKRMSPGGQPVRCSQETQHGPAHCGTERWTQQHPLHLQGTAGQSRWDTRRRVMEKLFEWYFGDPYTMVCFYLDMMFCYLDRSEVTC